MGTKRIINMNATTDFESDDNIVVDSETAGTRKMAQSVLKEKLSEDCLAGIHNLTPATDFATGDTIVVDNATDGPRGMDKDVLLAKTAQNALGSIHNLPTAITAFRTGDVIPVDGPDGTAKMPKDSLLQTTTNEAKKINDFDRLYSITNALRLTDSVKGYVSSSGNINTEANETFRYFVCKVEVGTPYVVRTRLGTSTTFIAGGDSADQTTGLTKYKNQNTDPNVLRDYEIIPTKEYLFVSFHKLENVAPYTSDDWQVFVVKKDNYTQQLDERLNALETDNFFHNLTEKRLDGSGAYVAFGNSVLGYVSASGNINTEVMARFRYFVCKVEQGKKYIVHTKLGTATTYIAGGDTADQTTGLTVYAHDTTHYSEFVDYKITASKPYLFVSFFTPATETPYTQDDGLVFVISSNVEDIEESLENLSAEVDFNGKSVKRLMEKEEIIDIGVSKKDYVNTNGKLAFANYQFRHFVCKVEVGKKVYVHTRLGTNTCAIAGGDSADQTTGLTVYKSNSINPNELLTYEITPTKEYLFISFRKVENVAPYTSDDWEAYATTEAPAVDTTGIVPSNFVSDGFTPEESENVLSGTGVFVAWGHTQASRQVSRIKFYANQSGFVRFGVGIIDQRNWAIVDQYADVPCNAGPNDINVLGYGLVIPRNGYLFTYNNADGDGTCVVWKTYASGSVKGLVFTDDPSSAFNKVINASGEEVSGTAGTDKSYAVPCLMYEMLNESLFYQTSVNGNSDHDWLIRTINETAQAKALSNVLNVGGSKYKIEKDNSGVALAPFKYNKIVIFGNSIFNHGALSDGWLYDQTIDGTTYSYAGESDGGMSGMGGRGMAASVQVADFKHRILAQAQKFNASVVVQGANIYGIERPSSGVFPTGSSFGYGNLLTQDVDCIIYAAGENVSMVNDSYREALESWVKYWQTSCPSALIVLCGRYWKQNKCDQITYDVAHKLGLPFVWKRMDEDTQAARDQIIKYPVTNGSDTIEVYGRLGSGASHPGDVGMYRIAKDICNVIGLECDELEHSVVIEQSSEYLVYAPKTWVAGGLCTLLFSGDTAPNVSVSKADGTSITTVTKTKAEMGFAGNHNFGVAFVMPDEDVWVSISAN